MFVIVKVVAPAAFSAPGSRFKQTALGSVSWSPAWALLNLVMEPPLAGRHNQLDLKRGNRKSS